MTLRYSIVIPARNAQATIGRCLASISALDYPPEQYEVIVINDDSTDRTAEIALAHGVSVIPAKCESIAAVRNFGAARAKDALIAFLDSDMEIDPAWLKTADKYFDGAGAGILHCATVAPEGASLAGRLWNSPHRQSRRGEQSVAFLCSTNFILPKDLFDRSGGFDEELFKGGRAGEDTEFTYRLFANGTPLKIDRSLRMLHLGCEKSLSHLIKKEWWHQGWTIFIARKHGWPWRLTRNPAFSFLHLAYLLLFISSWFFSGVYVSLVMLLLWSAPSCALLLRRMDLSARPADFPATWLLTFLRWNVAGLALIPQAGRLVFPKKGAKK
jgi:glycosyltransferase involved in cell wall biosynthesis